MKENPLITIYIVHYNKIEKLKKTVDFLFKNTYYNFKLKVLNNGYINKEIKDFLKELEQKGIEVVYLKKNYGPSYGRKILLKDINTKYLFSLDDDIYVPKNWDKAAIKYLENDSQIGGVGFMLKESGNIKVGGKRLYFDDKKKLLQIEELKLQKKDRFMGADTISSGAFLYKKELSNYFNWDPNYFIGFEDLDKGLQLYYSGYNFVIDTKTIFYHDKVSLDFNSTIYNQSRRNYNVIRKAYIRFVNKWGYRLEWKRDIFYKYFCILPNPVLRNFAYLKLKYFSKNE